MKTIKTLINDYLSYCEFEKNLSLKTIKSYKTDLRQFTEHIVQYEHRFEMRHIDKMIIKSFHQSISGNKPKTVKRKIATLKAMFNYMEFEDIILVNPFRKLKIKIREPKVLPNVMNIREIEEILCSAYRNKDEERFPNSYSFGEKVRDIAVMELLFATGIRVSELSYLKENCIDLLSGLIKVQGKGNRERIIQICNYETLNALRAYNKIFQSKITAGTGFFFINRFNGRLSEQSVRFLVKKHARIIGIKRKITPHSFRHSFATLLLEEDVDIKYIQHLLGHSSILTTQIYTHVNSIKQKQILERHPRKNFRISKANN